MISTAISSPLMVPVDEFVIVAPARLKTPYRPTPARVMAPALCRVAPLTRITSLLIWTPALT
jgi:hypothetical protein